MVSWVEPVLSNEDVVSCSRTQHRAAGEIRTHYLAIKSPALYQLSFQCSLIKDLINRFKVKLFYISYGYDINEQLDSRFHHLLQIFTTWAEK